MATRTTKSRQHRDVFTLAASLGYTPKAVAGLRQKVADTDFTAQLEARRQSAGLTQAEVARRMGVTQSTVSRLDRIAGKTSGSANWMPICELLVAKLPNYAEVIAQRETGDRKECCGA